MAPRSIWNGTIAFGSVAVPIKLHSATESRSVHFHEVHLADGSRIEHRTFCSKEGKEVPRDEVVKGFEVREGRYVVVDQDEIAAAGGSRSRIIDVDRFVPVADIDPVFYAKAYFLGARDEGADAYRLLRDALAKTGRAAIGRFTFHNREYLVAIAPYDDILVLHTMRFADELVDVGDLPMPDRAGKPKPQEVKAAKALIDSLETTFRPDRLHDEYRETVLAAIARKAEGEELEIPEEPDREEPDDLMAALKASIGDRTSASKTKKKPASATKRTSASAKGRTTKRKAKA